MPTATGPNYYTLMKIAHRPYEDWTWDELSEFISENHGAQQLVIMRLWAKCQQLQENLEDCRTENGYMQANMSVEDIRGF